MIFSLGFTKLATAKRVNVRVLADSNILVSALFYPKSKPAKVILHVQENYTLVLTEYILSEFRRISYEKFKANKCVIEAFLDALGYELLVVKLRDVHTSVLYPIQISDPKDVPILISAIENDIDIIVSGDKHFMRAKVSHPTILSAAQYLYAFDCK
jgi:putative PIN family toxin of toxin-antitoxin system